MLMAAGASNLRFVRKSNVRSGSDIDPAGMPLKVSQHCLHLSLEGRSAGFDGDGTLSCHAVKGYLDSIKLKR